MGKTRKPFAHDIESEHLLAILMNHVYVASEGTGRIRNNGMELRRRLHEYDLLKARVDRARAELQSHNSADSIRAIEILNGVGEHNAK